ncbi:hypothetical protein LUTEI9C_70024 [Luteimonas sp. 9C]|nr:hypothetical protein LUTEI9C_70024 [Luteimonas sp. 9C]
MCPGARDAFVGWVERSEAHRCHPENPRDPRRGITGLIDADMCPCDISGITNLFHEPAQSNDGFRCALPILRSAFPDASRMPLP